MSLFSFFNRKKIKTVKKIKDARLADREILKHLKNQGDDESIIRPIRHYCYFNTKEDLNKFLGLPKISEAQKEPLENNGIGVVIIVQSSVNETELFPQIEEITALTIEAGGNYDGWETTIVK